MRRGVRIFIEIYATDVGGLRRLRQGVIISVGRVGFYTCFRHRSLLLALRCNGMFGGRGKLSTECWNMLKIVYVVWTVMEILLKRGKFVIF